MNSGAVWQKHVKRCSDSDLCSYQGCKRRATWQLVPVPNFKYCDEHAESVRNRDKLCVMEKIAMRQGREVPAK